MLAKAGCVNKEKHVTFKEPSAEPEKGQMLVTISESGDGGGHGVTSTESQVENEAPPSGESDIR